MDHAQRILAAILANEISTLFAVLIAAIFVLGCFGRLPGLHLLFGALDRSGPGLMTTLGVLGTFTGIFIGLLDFEVAQIDASVPKLLEGMKIAFATSIAGMGAAVTFKIVQTIIPEPADGGVGATPENILAALNRINESVDRSAQRHHGALEEVRRAISSDTDSSLLTQVQKLRTSVQDGQKELITAFQEFAETMAENNSKALIEALEHVIRDFNTQLNEQFGENFKQLNEAVGALLTWQENYRAHVETLEARIDAAVEALELSKDAITEISDHTAKIPQMLTPLSELLAGLQASIIDLEAHLEAVAGLKDRAMEAFPVVEKNVQTLTTEFAAAVSSSVDTMKSAVDKQQQAFGDLREGYTELRDAARQSQDAFTTSLDRALEAMQKNLTTALDGHAKGVEATTTELNAQIREQWSKTQDAINQQFEALDAGMQQELTRALELMGRNLASLSEKFVSDYGPLTNRLRDIVQMAERAS